MKPVLTRAQMRAYDRYAITRALVPSVVLMENAGRGAAEVLTRLVAPGSARVVVVCGSGNNGGDGFVLARHLLAAGFDVTCLAAGALDKLTSDARVHHDAYVGLRGRCIALEGRAAMGTELATANVIVDALFGTGLDRAVEGRFREVIEAINAARALKLALDVPSGLDADTGAVLGAAVRADHTVTFACLKMGLLSPGGLRHAGTVHVVSLGLPGWLVDEVGLTAQVIDEGAVRAWLAPRPVTTYKHAAGNVLALAGSAGKLGAALLVGRAALRAGAGLVTLGIWPEAEAGLQARVFELMTTPLDRADLLGSVDRALQGKGAVVIGPGFGLDAEARAVVEHVVLRWNGRKVVDADALTLLSPLLDALVGAPGEMVLTPHAGEAGRLLGTSAAAVEADRAGAARELARRTGATVVLKGPRTLVAHGESLLINESGSAALATAGSGDVLSGVLGALACVMPLERAAAVAVHLHGLAAEQWSAERRGADRGLLAGEIADLLPAVLAAVAGRAPDLPI